MVPSALLAHCEVMTAVFMTALLIAYGRLLCEGATFAQAGAQRLRTTRPGRNELRSFNRA